MTFDEACSYEIIQKKISLGKNPVDEFRNSAQYSNRYTFFFNGCQQFREVLFAKTDSFHGKMIN